MQRLNTPVESVDESAIARPSDGSPPRANGTVPPAPTGAATVDMSRSYSMEKGKRLRRFPGEFCVHSIPVVVILCYLCLWMASSEIPRSEDQPSILRPTGVPVRASVGFPGDYPSSQVSDQRPSVRNSLSVVN